MAFLGMGSGAEAARLVISLAVTSGPAMKSLGDVQAKMAEMGRGIKDSLSKPLQEAMFAFGNIGDAADGLRSVGNAVQTVAGAMIGGAAKMETYALQFEVLLGSASAAQERMADLANYANTTPFELPGVVEASRLLQTFTGGALAAGEGLRMVGNIAAGTGKPIEDVAFKVGRLYDAFKSGTNIGESLMYLQEMGAITGETRREIEGLAEQVKTGAISMNEGWAKASEGFSKFNGMTEKLSQSAEGKMSTAIDAVNMSMAKLGESVLPMVKVALDGVVKVMDVFNGVAEKAKKYWFVLAPFVIAAAKAFAGYTRAALAASGATGVLGVALKALPIIGWITLAIAALEVFALAWENNFLGIRTIVESVMKWLGDNFGWLGDILGGIANVVGTIVGSVQSSFTDLTPTMDAATQTWTKYTDAQQKAIDSMAASRARMKNVYGNMASDAKASSDEIISAVGRPATYIRDNWATEGYAAEAAADATMAGILEAVKRRGREIVEDSRKVTRELVAEILSRNKSLADAASGAMSVATAESFAVAARTAAKAALAQNLADIKSAQDQITALKKGGITKQEADQIAGLKKEIENLRLARPGLKLEYDQRLADLTQYGSDAQRILYLAGAAAAESLQAGLSSKSNAIRWNTIFRLGELYTELNNLKNKTYQYGLSTMSEYGRGMKEGGSAVIEGVRSVVADVNGFLRADSPPRDPRNPLSKIGLWGYNTGEAWGTGLSAGLKYSADNATRVLDTLKLRFQNFQSFLASWPAFSAQAITNALNKTVAQLSKIWSTISTGERMAAISQGGDEILRREQASQASAAVQAVQAEIDTMNSQMSVLWTRLNSNISAASKAILLARAQALDAEIKRHRTEIETLQAAEQEAQRAAEEAARAATEAAQQASEQYSYSTPAPTYDYSNGSPGYSGPSSPTVNQTMNFNIGSLMGSYETLQELSRLLGEAIKNATVAAYSAGGSAG